MKQKINMVFRLQTPPALTCGKMALYRKELIKVGQYVKESTKQAFSVSIELIDHWVATFDKWVAGGNKVSVPLGHENAGDASANMGWVRGMHREGDTLIGELELLKADLALTSDVSIAVPAEVTDGKGIKYVYPITHVALTTEPVVGGLKDFETMSLSLSKGDNMEFLKKIAEKLGLKDAEPTEESVLLALGTGKKTEPEPKSKDAVDPLVKLVSENRELKLSNLVKAGIITPAVKDVITAKYVETEVLALSMAQKQDDGFDLLFDVLKENHPVALDETSGVQDLELANRSAEKPNAMAKEITRRRKAEGLEK